MSKDRINSETIKAMEVAAYDDCAHMYSRFWGRCTEEITGDLVDLLDPSTGETCIDVAGGTGAAGLQVAERVGPAGRVLIADISPGMVREARRLADARGLRNVDTTVMDAEALDAPDGSFSIAISTFGLMFVPDIRQATSEIARVLSDDGRAAIAVWGPLDRVPVVRLQLDSVHSFVGGPLREGFLPDRFGREGELEAALQSAGFVDLHLETRTFTTVFQSVDHYVEATYEGTPMKSILRDLPPGSASRAVAGLRNRCQPADDGSIGFSNDVRFIIGRLATTQHTAR